MQNYSKKICLNLITPIFVLCLFSQNIFHDREDFPFSQWGMYKYLKKEGPYQKVSMELIVDGKSMDLFQKYYSHAFAWDDLIRIEILGVKKNRFSSPAYSHLGKRERFLKIMDEVIYPRLKKNKDYVLGSQIIVYQNFWEKISRQNLFQPDRREVMFKDTLK